tara:strand:- start:591 stop:1223 length:633 start_codon:yes stop_codon:yes gene_type:complete
MNITKTVNGYIDQHPSVRDCITKGLMNYSALSRAIAADLSLDSEKHFDALLIACRRYFDTVKGRETLEGKIKTILKQSRIEVKNKICVVVVEKDVYFTNVVDLHKEIKSKAETFHMIEGSDTITLITTEQFLSRIEKLFKEKILKITKELAELNLKSSQDMEQTPGVIAHLTTLLAGHGINIIETMSTWTDTLFVIAEKDIAKAMDVLRF